MHHANADIFRRHFRGCGPESVRCRCFLPRLHCGGIVPDWHVCSRQPLIVWPSQRSALIHVNVEIFGEWGMGQNLKAVSMHFGFSTRSTRSHALSPRLRCTYSMLLPNSRSICWILLAESSISGPYGPSGREWIPVSQSYMLNAQSPCSEIDLQTPAQPGTGPDRT